ELESGLALFFKPGVGGLHDAFWGVLLMGGLALLQLGILSRRQPMSNLRKFAMWAMLIATLLMIVAMIQGFHHDFFAEGGLAVTEASHVIFFFGFLFEVVGILAAAWGAWRASSFFWLAVIGGTAVVGALFAIVIYSLSYAGIVIPDLTAMGI